MYDISVDDASDYTCEVDIMGRPISIDHRLEVLIAPQIQAKESKVRLLKGENHTLRCSAHGQPNPSIMWEKKVTHVICISKALIFIMLQQAGSIPPISGLSLHLVSVDRHAEGVYICKASNGVGKNPAATIKVEVQLSFLLISGHFLVI